MKPSAMLFWAIALVIGASFSALAQDDESSYGSDSSSASDYLKAVGQLKGEPIEKQIQVWRTFLQDHPETSFRTEIESNLKNLEELLLESDPSKQKEKKDTERYLKAVAYAKKLSPQDQILLWKQFIEENPDSLYRREASATLQELRAKYGREPAPLAPFAPSQSQRQAIPVVLAESAKDPDDALMLAMIPGLIVPGLGHWYTKDFVLAGVITGVRVGGAAILIPGIVQGNPSMQWVGGLLSGFGYLLDVVDAPFSATRYNEEQGTASIQVGPESIVVSLRF